jgi:hypothetical protein
LGWYLSVPFSFSILPDKQQLLHCEKVKKQAFSYEERKESKTEKGLIYTFLKKNPDWSTKPSQHLQK